MSNSDISIQYDKLKKERDELYHIAKESQDWNWLSAYAHAEETGMDYLEITEMQDLIDQLKKFDERAYDDS